MPNDLGIFMTELGADCVATAGDVLGDDSLRTAVILSLFCHRRAEDEDVIPDGTSNKRGWWADTYLAIDQGPIAVMIENHRSELLWRLFMSHPDVQNGLRKLGFESPVLQ